MIKLLRAQITGLQFSKRLAALRGDGGQAPLFDLDEQNLLARETSAIVLAILLSVLQDGAAIAGPASSDCQAIRASALVDPDFPPPASDPTKTVPLVSSIGCKEYDNSGKLVGIWVQTTTGDGSATISNTTNVNTTLLTSSPTHPAILHATASPQFLQWVDAPAWGYVIPGNPASGPIQLLVYSSGVAPYPTDYYSGPISITNSGNLITENSSVVPISARGSISSVTILNSGNIVSAGSRVSAISAFTGMDSRTDDNGIAAFDWGIPDKYYPGGAIFITNSGAIDIAGSYGIGLLAKTLGGGITIGNTAAIKIDGADGAAIRAYAESNLITITNSAALTVDGDGGVGIEGTMLLPGAVDVTNNGAITITGNQAIGINVLNANAGGDASGASTSITGQGVIKVTGDDATGIDATNRLGGSLTVDYSGKIIVDGSHAMGIHASTDEGADIAVKAIADVSASGASAIGIVVSGLGEGITNSDGTVTPLTHGQLSAEIANGVTVQGGSLGSDDGELAKIAAGVAFVGGTANTLINRGTITADSGLAVIAFEGTQTITDDSTGDTINLRLRSGPLTVQNYGTIAGDIISGSAADVITNHASGVITGNIDLGEGANSFDNLENALVNSRDRIFLGAGTFTNAGTLSPGGAGSIQSTTVVGNFVQTANGHLAIDIDNAAITKSDFVAITGTATLAGVVDPNAVNKVSSTAGEYKILSADGGVTMNGIIATDTIGYNYEVEKRGSNDVYLTSEKSGTLASIAAAAGSSGNSGGAAANNSAAAEAAGKFEASGGSDGATVGDALRNLGSSQQFSNALQRIAPENGGQQTNSTNSSNGSFSNSMLSCASRDQPYRFTKEETCYYAKFTARKLDRDATTSSVGHDETGYEFIAGTQVNLGGDLRGGIALGYENTSSQTQSLTQNLGTTSGDRIHGGFVLKNQWGPINAYLNVAGSYGWYEHTRFVNLGGFANAYGEQDVASALVKLRLSYLNEIGSWYIKPLVDVGATYVNLGGYSETGAGAFNLTVGSASAWIFGVMPAVEIGAEFSDGSGTLYRPFIRGGVTIYDKDNLTFSANFASAPVGVAGFTVVSELDNVFADVGAGVQVLTVSGTNLKFEYEGRFGEHTTQNAGSIKVTFPY